MPTPRITEEGALRRARILELRRQRWTWPEIGRDVGISPQRAFQLYQKALVEIPTPHLEEHRAEELVLIDDAINNLIGIAKDAKVTPHARIEAWNSVRGWAERKAKLLGLDAPDRVEVITIDQIDRELARLAALIPDGSEVPAAG